jgi:hypothetical protein
MSVLVKRTRETPATGRDQVLLIRRGHWISGDSAWSPAVEQGDETRTPVPGLSGIHAEEKADVHLIPGERRWVVGDVRT